jgi:hypothetical protein
MSDQKKIKQKDIKCNQHAYTPVFFDDKEASADSLYIFVVNDGKFVLVSDRGQINIKPGLGVEVSVPALTTDTELNYKLHKITAAGDNFLCEGKIKITQLPSTEPVKQEPADAKP